MAVFRLPTMRSWATRGWCAQKWFPMTSRATDSSRCSPAAGYVSHGTPRYTVCADRARHRVAAPLSLLWKAVLRRL